MNPLFKPSRRSFRLAMVLLSGSALAGVPLLSAALAETWTGATSTDWFTASNWDTNTVPTAATSGVTIATLTPNATVINGGNAFSGGGLFVGEVTPGSLTISNGGTFNNTSGLVIIGSNGGAGTMSVTGVGSTLISPQGIEVALGSNGTLGIANGASVSSDSLIMAGTGGISLVTVDGAGSLLSIGSLGMIEGPLFSPPASATLAITNGAHVMDSGTADIGNDVGQATITVDGTGSLFQGAGTITIGDYVNGAVAVTNGGVVSGGADIVIAGTSVNAPNAIGTVTVDGAGSQMNAVGNIIVGNYGTGSLTVRNGAQIDAVDLIAGYFPGSNGTAVITGTGSTAILTAAVAGLEGAGSLSVLNGATLGAMAYDIGIGGGTGVGVVDGPGSLVAASDHLAVGAIGSNGTLTISNGGIINDTGYADIGYTGGGTGTVTVRDENSALNVTGNLVVGSGGAGTLILTNGGTFSGSTVDLGVTAGSQGTLSISTNGSIATATALTIGDAGTGLLSLDNFGALTTATAVVGAQSGSTGTALVANASGGGHTTLETTQDLIVGRDSGATGSVTLSNFGQVESDGTIEVGESAGATGTITSTGTGALLISGSNLSIGEGGTGTVNIQAGSGAYAEALTYIGHQQGATGTLSVDGAGSIFNAFGNLSIGGDDANATGGNGSVSVTNGGTIAAQQFILIGGSAGSTGTVTVSGTGSNITGTSLLAVGDQGTGTLSVLNGATVTDLVGNIGNQGSGTATVDGAGSSLVLSSLFTVGNFGSGILTVSNGGAISSGDLYVGGGAGVSGLVTVTDAGSTMTGDGVVNIGYQGAGDLILQAGGVFVAPGGVTIAAQAGSSGEIEIGANFANPAAAPGVLSTPTVTFGAGDGTLVFNHTSSQYAFAPTITGLGEILTLAGVTDLTANSSGFAGTANVQGGTLLVDGTLGGNGVSVEAAGTFGGKGTVTNVTVADGGTLLGVEGQTLNMTSLSLSNGSNVNVTLGAPGGAGLFAVSQSITLDGVLNIAAATGFNAGVYRLVDYGGALTDNGLDIGATPSGTAASDFVVQTSVAGQVNLVDSHASILNFWDGAAAGSANNGAIDGGNGVWSVTVPNWTDVNGQSNGAMAPQPGFAVFEAAPGTVTVDDSAGAVSVTGMQFASSGYTVTGDAITLASGGANIRVGDGTAAGAGYSATIASVLTGDGTLIKTDLGTLILTGANTYTGGTSINAGTLQIGNGGTTGSIVGDINLNGTLIFDRSDVMNFNSRIFSNNAIVIQAGSGTTILGTSQSYSGQTIISAGTLQGASASFGSSSILDNATLMINQATDAVFANVISGAGTFIKQGAGTLALVGASDFTGTTDIEQGTLQIGAGGTDGSITGNILDNATLSFDRSDAVAFGGVISGSGSVTKAGNGTTTLTGANTYNGGTTVAVGTLVGSATSFGTGAIVDSTALVIDQPSSAALANAISGGGSLTKQGAGTLTLTGANTYSGGTTVAAGTLAGTAISFGSGAIADNAALVFNQAVDAAFGNVISGTGTFVKQGAGSLNLTAASPLTGSATVAAGRLAVNGSLASVVTVQSGATLGGNGTVGGIVAQAGSNVGPGNSIGDLKVAGNYSAASGSVYQVELDSAGHADRIDVSGTAVIANGAVLNVTKTDTGGYIPGTQYTVLTATGGVTGTYILTGNTAQSFFGGLGAVYTPTSVVLQIQQTKSFASAGGTPNQIATGGGADTLPASNALVSALLGLPDAATAQGAFDRLSGEIYASSRTALVEDSRLVREAALARLQATGAGTVVWGQGFGDWGSADGDGNAARLSRRTTGFIGGADTAAGDWRLGALAGYSRDGITVADRASSGSGDSYHLGIYGGTQAAGINLRGGASYSWHSFNIARAVTFNGFAAPTSGHVTGDTVQGFAEAGYPLDAGSVRLEPFGNIAHVDVSLGGLQESGGAADLRIGDNDSAVTFTTLGAHLSHAAELQEMSLSLRASLGWRHALGDVVPASVNSFVGGGGFTVAGVPVARDSLAAEAGLDAAIADDLTLSIAYTGQYATNARDSGGKLGLRWMLQ